MEQLLAIAGKPGLSWAQQAPTSGQDSPQSGQWSMGQATWIKMDGALSGRATSELNSRCGHFFGERKCTCGGSSARFYETHQYSTIWPSFLFCRSASAVILEAKASQLFRNMCVRALVARAI